MSAAQPGGSATATEVETWRAQVQLRCGQAQVPMHLVDADAQLTRVWWRLRRDRVAVCGAVLDESTPVPDFLDADCPGCADCVRYCAKCAGEVARFALVAVP